MKITITTDSPAKSSFVQAIIAKALRQHALTVAPLRDDFVAVVDADPNATLELFFHKDPLQFEEKICEALPSPGSTVYESIGHDSVELIVQECFPHEVPPSIRVLEEGLPENDPQRVRKIMSWSLTPQPAYP